MSPPPLPLASPGGTLPASHASHMHAFPPLSPGLSSGADAAHAPMRHPRPLTAAELHLELEKEQEAVVNRLTRELSNLRAHSASVASTVSSVTSGAGAGGDADFAGNAGVYPPTSSSTSTAAAAAAAAAAARRERRSSSSVHISVAPGSAKAIAKELVEARGWSDNQYDCLVSLWNHESGWRVSASNPSGAYGIPQALPGSKMSSAGSDWETSAETQIKWGLGYIKARYNTPCGAWGFWQSNNYY